MSDTLPSSLRAILRLFGIFEKRAENVTESGDFQAASLQTREICFHTLEDAKKHRHEGFPLIVTCCHLAFSCFLVFPTRAVTPRNGVRRT